MTESSKAGEFRRKILKFPKQKRCLAKNQIH